MADVKPDIKTALASQIKNFVAFTIVEQGIKGFEDTELDITYGGEDNLSCTLNVRQHGRYTRSFEIRVKENIG